MEAAKIYFIVFGALTIAGGIVGYVKAGSAASIIAGSITGVLLLVAAFLLPEHRTIGLATALIVSFLLAAQFVPKFLRTGRVMPAGMMSILSVIGITLHSTVETLSGADAATERTQPESYLLDLKLQARVPSPNKTIEELAKVSPQLPTLLPGLASMFSADPVSPLYAQLYDSKVRMLRENLARLDLLLSRHNFFDGQTVLQMQHPQKHRKELLLQADMDWDAYGSDSS